MYIERWRHLFAFIYHIDHVRCQNKRYAIALEATNDLGIPEESTVVDVEEPAVTGDHDVIIMAVADP